MSYKLLTNLLFEPRGKHNPSLTYNIKDTVMSEDGSKVYFALDNVPAGIPLTDTNYWMLQMDLSASKNAMDVAAANARTQTDATIASANTRVEDMMGKAAEAVTSVADYATKVGMRVKGETKITKGNPMTIYPDGGSLLKVQTDIPIKQLGEGDPYPGGSGKNLCPPLSGVKTESGVTFTPNADGSVTVSGAATAQSAVGTQQFILKVGTYTVSGAPVGGAIGSYDIYVFKADGTGTIARSYNGINETFTISNDTNVALAMRVPTGAVDTSKVFWPMIEVGSTATAFMPYSNIRPFIGYDKLNLGAAGKNLCNPDEFTQGDLSEGRYLTNSVDTNNVSGYVPVSPNTTYTRSSNCVSGSREIALYDANKIFLSRTFGETFTTPSNCYFVRLEWESTYPLTESWFQLELGSEPTPYEPYKGKLHTVQLYKTTYQGHYDWLTGKFKAEWKGMRLLSSYVSTSMKYVSGYVGAWMNEVLVNDRSEGQETILCSHLLGRNVYNWSCDGVYVQGGNTIGIQFSGASIPGYTDTGNADQNAGLVRAYLDANDVRIAWKLATPIEMQLAPNVITAIEDGGMNTIYGDGDIQVEYVKPLSESIKERTDILLDAFSESFETSGSIIQCEPIWNWPFDSVVTEFAPKQAGSGEPYPAGGGKNLIDVTVFDTVWLKGVISLTAGITYTLSVQETADALYFSNEGGTVDYATAYNAKHLTYTPETSGIYIMFARYANGADLAYNMMLEKGSAATEYAPYSNVRPITGYDKLDLNQVGKNIVPWPYKMGGFGTVYESNGLTAIVNDDYSITVNGTATGSVYLLIGTMNLGSETIIPGGTNGVYALSDRVRYNANTGMVSINFSAGDVVNNNTFYPQIELGTAATKYETPRRTLHTVQIGQTVYGGKLDWLTGKLVADEVMREFDGSADEGWNPVVGPNGNYRYFIAVPGVLHPANNALVPQLLSNKYVAITPNDSYLDADYGVSGQDDNDIIWINDARFANGDIAAFRAELAVSPVQVAYKLATPIEIQLTPTQIIALTGVNTLYGDGDTITAKFRQSKDVDILKRLSALETLMTNQTKGE